MRPWILNKGLLFVLVFFGFIVLCSATFDVSIDVSDSFGFGDQISFDYNISSSDDYNITYIASIVCDKIPQPLVLVKEKNLIGGEVFSSEYSYGIVDGFVVSDDCYASVQIVSPFELSYNENFTIVSKERFDFKLNVCRDAACTSPKKSFIQGDKVFLDYDSTVSGVNIVAELKTPNSPDYEAIVLPYNFNAYGIGVYNLKVYVTKDGYIDNSAEVSFAVLADDVTFEKKDFTGYPVAHSPSEKVTRESGSAMPLNVSDVSKGINRNWVAAIVLLFLLILLVFVVILLVKSLKHRR